MHRKLSKDWIPKEVNLARKKNGTIIIGINLLKNPNNGMR